MKHKGNKTLQVVPDGTEDSPAAGHQRRLLELAETIDLPNAFRKGQLVTWKDGLRNRKYPAYGEVAVVRDVLTSPIHDGCDEARCTGSPNFGEPLTLVLALIDPDGDFLEYYYDGRRFQPAEA